MPPTADRAIPLDTAPSPTTVAERLVQALDLYEEGLELMRQNLRRRCPEAADGEIEEALFDWICHPSGARWGDASGSSLREIV